MVGPWGAILIGIVAGIISALSFIYLHPKLCKIIGALDVMGVHNLHGVAGWFGALVSVVLLFMVGSDGIPNLITAVGVFIISLVLGAVVGFLMKLMRGKMPDENVFNDDADFIKSEAPA
jgi:ammonium transporter Rh